MVSRKISESIILSQKEFRCNFYVIVYYNMDKQIITTKLNNVQRLKKLQQARNQKWYKERGSIQAKIKTIMNSKKYNIDVDECFYALDTQYKPVEDLKLILDRLHQYILIKKLY